MIRSFILLLLVAGCAGTAPDRSSGAPSGTSPSGTSPSGTSPSARATPDAAPSAAPSDPLSRPSAGHCGAGPVTVMARRGEVPKPLCLAVGATLRVGAEPSPNQPWMPLTSSDAEVLRCVSHPGPGGSIDATCTAVRPGHATVSTVTSPFAGDPHGPPQFRWALEITVVRTPS